MSTVEPAAPIDPSAYTEEYYLAGVEGHELFRSTGGRALSPRLARAMDLAAVRPGDRLIDVGCGRGEVVLQASLMGATAIGIDYAAAALPLARQALRSIPLPEAGRGADRRQVETCPRDEGPSVERRASSIEGSAGVVRMDATRLALREEHPSHPAPLPEGEGRLAAAGDGRAGVARMDATRLALREGSFDAAVMLDFVEHVHQPDLERSFAELARSLRPGGRLVIHTSPNRVLEEMVYPRYVRNVHRVLLAAGRLCGVRNWFFNEIVLPTGPVPDHDEFERELHVNPQSARSLRRALEGAGFRVRRVDFWEPPAAPFFPERYRWRNVAIRLLDTARFLRPVSRWPPLDRLFSNHIWVVAERH
jgi:cyclopropane fatty-acyl-phospholipid synthase-like methyltransferase